MSRRFQEGAGGSCLLLANDFAHKTRHLKQRDLTTERGGCSNGQVTWLAGHSNNEEGSEYENGILAGGRDGSRAGNPRDAGGFNKDRVGLYVQRSARRDRQRYAQFVRARA